MITFFNWYKNDNPNEEIPKDSISADWFFERGLPMIVECACCGMTMALPSAYISDDEYCYCACCAGVE